MCFRQEARNSWRIRQNSFFKKCAGKDNEKRDRAPKMHRQKTFEFLVGLQNQLTAMTGIGLERFRISAGQESRPETWPRLTIASDQGADMMCAWSFLSFGPLKLCIDQAGDLSHGCWNDVKASHHKLHCIVLRDASTYVVHRGCTPQRLTTVWHQMKDNALQRIALQSVPTNKQRRYSVRFVGGGVHDKVA